MQNVLLILILLATAATAIETRRKSPRIERVIIIESADGAQVKAEMEQFNRRLDSYHHDLRAEQMRGK